MSIFDENEVVASHQKLATVVSSEVNAIATSIDLIRKTIQYADRPRDDPELHATFLTVSHVVLRIVNNAGATSCLVERGYFVQAACHLRDTAETAMLILLFAEDRNQIANWRNSGQNRYSKFGRSKIKKALNTDEFRTKFDWLDSYFNLFSEFGVHPSPASIVGQHDGNNFHFGSHYNKSMYVNTYKDMASLTWHATNVCGNLWNSLAGEDLNSLFPVEMEAYYTAWSGIAPTE